MTIKKGIFAASILGCFLGSTSASAIDTNEVMQCAIMEAVICGPRMGCETGGADMINLPNFVQIDIKGGQITGNRPDNTELATQIERVESLEGSIIIQGGEEDLGWTILVDEETGGMTVSGSRGDEGLIIFGACIQK